MPFRKRRWQTKPNVQAPIDRNHLAAQYDMLGAFNFVPCGKPVNQAPKVIPYTTAWVNSLPDFRGGPGGIAAQFDVATTSTNRYAKVFAASDISGTGVTIMHVRRCRDTTNRASAGFGLTEATVANRCGAHLPYSDNKVHWDFGGSNGNNRVTWLGYSKVKNKLEVWFFRAGTQGSSIWLDGEIKASKSVAITRTVGGFDGIVGDGNGGINLLGDAVDILQHIHWNDELPDALIKKLSANPWDIWQPLQPIYIDAPAGGAISVPNGNLTLTAGTPKQTMLQIHKVPAHGT